MFKKKPSLKPLAPLRSSDRRKLVDLIIKQYGIDVSKSKETNEDGAENVSINAFRNAILPEGALCAAFATTVGSDQKVVKGTIYIGLHSGEPQRILWIKQDDGRLIPTVYTLWRHPGILPLLHTPDIVLQKMREGAELNTPGLIGPPFPRNATKDSIVAISSYEEPRIPMVVGICEIDVSVLTDVRGQKGHAVRPLHWEGDEVWNWGQYGQGGGAAPENIDGWVPEKTNDTDIDGPLRNLSLTGEGNTNMIQRNVLSESNMPQEELQETSPSKEWTTKDIDEAFHQAFLYSLHQARTSNTNTTTHGISFPISQSQFISSFINPYLPIFTEQDASVLQIKKTSWKSAKKLIKSLDKKLLLKSKDRNGGETVILDVDFDDQTVLDFTPYRLPPREAASVGFDPTSSNNEQCLPDPSVGQKLKRLAVLRPKEKFSFLFGSLSQQNHYLPNEIKLVVTKYIEKECLVDSQNKRLVKLDPALANAVFDSTSSLDQEVLTKGTVPREVLANRVVNGCSPFWAILRNEESLQEAKLRPGKPPTIKIQMETRSGNKIATKISGLEDFRLNPQILAEDLQRICASSTSASPLPGSSSKNSLIEVMVQGSQKDAVIKALEKRGVKKDWIELLDKTKGKKR